MEARDLLRERPRAFELSLRIRHPSIDPVAISRELHLKPDHSFKVGEPRESSSGFAATSVHAESYWLGTLDFSEWPTSLEDFDMSLLGQPRLPHDKGRLRGMVTDSLGMALSLYTTFFLRTHAEFLRRVQTEGGEIALIAEISASAMQGFSITPQVARSLSELGIHLEFEFTVD